MNKKLKTTMVLALTAGTIAFSTYMFVKTYKRVKAEMELEEQVTEETEKDSAVSEAIDLANKAMEDATRPVEDVYKYDTLEDITEEDVIIPEEIYEEDVKLLFAQDSNEALSQFINMKLAEVSDLDILDVLLRLYNIPFKPVVELDRTLYGAIESEREEFFGVGSKWNSKVSIGDVLTYFVEKTVFDYSGEEQEIYRKYLFNLGIDRHVDITSLNNVCGHLVSHDTTMFSITADDLSDICRKNNEVHGLFISDFRSEYNKELEVLMNDE